MLKKSQLTAYEALCRTEFAYYIAGISTSAALFLSSAYYSLLQELQKDDETFVMCLAFAA